MSGPVNRGASTTTLSGRLAEFSASLTLEQIPAAVLAHAKLLTLDTLGAALAGVATAEGGATLRAIPALAGAGGPATVWGTPVRTARTAAALVNGITAHAQELDDFGGCDHSGAVVLPAVLAAAEGRAVSGGRLLEAIVVGYDVALRVMEAAGGYRDHNGRGWHSTGTCGSFGAAAAAAKVLGLDAVATTSAIGIAGSFTGGTWAFLADGAMSKRYHPGRAAETGVVAAVLAQEGFTGPAQVFEAAWGGFFPTYAGDDAEPERLTAGLGREFKIMRSGVKPYACCRGAHSTLDAILDLRRRHSIAPDHVARVSVRCTAPDMQMLGDRDPHTRLAAQMSLPYSVAAALMTGRASLVEYEDARLNDPATRALMSRIDMEVDPSLSEGTEPYITVSLRNGASHTGHVDIGLGAPENPLPAAGVVAKYDDLSVRALSAHSAASVKQLVLGLEALPSVDALCDVLRTG
jgi:2-methylcitrate dehydratase PrpD